MENTQNSIVRKQQEEDRLAKEEADRLAAQQTTQHTLQNTENRSTDLQKKNTLFLPSLIVLTVAGISVLLLLILRRRQK